MAFLGSFDISASGMSAQRVRMDIAAENIANMDTTRTEIQKLPLHPLRDVRKLRGTLEEILEAEDGTGSEDYVSVTLTDEVDPYKPKEQLERKFHHILEVRMDNERTRQKLEFSEEQIRIGTPFETFCDFYKEMQGQEMSEQEQKILREILSEMKGEDV